jgi:hypothetical protein
MDDIPKIHHDRFMYFLPQMGSEYLNERDFQCRDLAVQENTRQVELHLETDVDVCTIDGGRPPQREPTIGNLVQTGSLGIGQFLEFHTPAKEGWLALNRTSFWKARPKRRGCLGSIKDQEGKARQGHRTRKARPSP